MNKFSNRIKSLSKLVLEHDYDCIYDTCCDHGKIGMALLEQKVTAKELVFVDIVAGIISQLELNIADIPNQDINLKTQTISITELKFSKKDLVIIAGVGADLILDAIRTHRKSGSTPKHYLLSSHTKHFMCRSALKEMGFKLVREILVEEAGIFYDHLLISAYEGEEILPINQTGEFEVLSRYYEHHAKILKLKAQYGDKLAANLLNIINSLTIA